MVNPVVGANYSGGAGSGGSIRIIAANINNQGILEAVGGVIWNGFQRNRCSISY